MSTFKLDDLRGNVSVKSLCNVARQLMATSIRSTLTCRKHRHHYRHRYSYLSTTQVQVYTSTSGTVSITWIPAAAEWSQNINTYTNDIHMTHGLKQAYDRLILALRTTRHVFGLGGQVLGLESLLVLWALFLCCAMGWSHLLYCGICSYWQRTGRQCCCALPRFILASYLAPPSLSLIPSRGTGHLPDLLQEAP